MSGAGDQCAAGVICAVCWDERERRTKAATNRGAAGGGTHQGISAKCVGLALCLEDFGQLRQQTASRLFTGTEQFYTSSVLEEDDRVNCDQLPTGRDRLDGTRLLAKSRSKLCSGSHCGNIIWCRTYSRKPDPPAICTHCTGSLIG